jgi:hypothetical protein
LSCSNQAAYLRTTRFNTQNIYTVLALKLSVLCGSQNRQRRFAVYIIKGSVFITVVESVYSAVRTDSLYAVHSARSQNEENKILASLCRSVRMEQHDSHRTLFFLNEI